MQLRSVIPVLLCASALVCVDTASAVPPRANDIDLPGSFAPIPSRIDAVDDLIESAMTSGHVPGLAAAVVTADGPIWYGAYGYAEFSPPRPVEISTLFMLASVSKVVAATAFMQVYELGLVGLDDDIDTHLPFVVDHPVYSSVPLTPRMLLCHVSSIDDNWSVMPYYAGDSPFPLGDYLEHYLTPLGSIYDPEQNFLTAAPGTQWHYSNIGLATAGYLVEAITDVTFDDHCDQYLFPLLGMNETAWHLADLDTSHVAMPYYWNGSTYEPYGHYGYSDYPSGQLRTSADQLGHFLQCYLRDGEYDGQRILEASTVALMLTSHYPSLSWAQGLGWRRDGNGWSHGGGDLGVSTLISFDRVDGYGVVVLTNGQNSGVTSYVVDLLYAHAHEITGVESHPPKPVAALHAICPNPFNPRVTIEFAQPSAGQVELTVYDLRGRRIAGLVDGFLERGNHAVAWQGQDDQKRTVPTGTYVARLVTAFGNDVRKLMLVR